MSPEEKPKINPEVPHPEKILPRNSIFAQGLKDRIKSKGISLEQAIEEIKTELEPSKEFDPEGYFASLSLLYAGAEYLKSLEKK